jgi:hypothetical protein
MGLGAGEEQVDYTKAQVANILCVPSEKKKAILGWSLHTITRKDLDASRESCESLSSPYAAIFWHQWIRIACLKEQAQVMLTRKLKCASCAYTYYGVAGRSLLDNQLASLRSNILPIVKYAPTHAQSYQ